MVFNGLALRRVIRPRAASVRVAADGRNWPAATRGEARLVRQVRLNHAFGHNVDGEPADVSQTSRRRYHGRFLRISVKVGGRVRVTPGASVREDAKSSYGVSALSKRTMSGSLSGLANK